MNPLFIAFSIADIAYRRRDPDAVFGLQRAEADLNGELRAVTAQSVEFQSGPHGAHPGVGGEALAVPAVSGAIPFGDQGLDGPSQQLTPRKSEQFFRLRV